MKKIKVPKIRITATDRNNKKDIKMAKLFQELIQKEYDDYKNAGFMSAIVQARSYIYMVTGFETPSSIWENIIKAVVKLRINDWKSK